MYMFATSRTGKHIHESKMYRPIHRLSLSGMG